MRLPLFRADCSVIRLYCTNCATRSNTYASTDNHRSIVRLLDYTVPNQLPTVNYAPTDIQDTIAWLIDYTVPTDLNAVTYMPIPIFRERLLGY